MNYLTTIFQIYCSLKRLCFNIFYLCICYPILLKGPLDEIEFIDGFSVFAICTKKKNYLGFWESYKKPTKPKRGRFASAPT